MPSLQFERRYQSYENLDDGFSEVRNLLDSVERNQKSGIYLRSHGDAYNYDELQTSFHPQSVITTQLQAQPFKAEKQLILDSGQSAPSVVHRNFVSRTRSLSPTRKITLRVISRPLGRDLSLYEDCPVAKRYHNIRTYDPLLSSHQKLQHFDDTRESVGKDIQRKIIESHRDLATLKKLISDTFGENDEIDSSRYRSRHFSGTDQGLGFKFDPEVYLDTLERRKRHSLDYSYPVEIFTPTVSTSLHTYPNTFLSDHTIRRQVNQPRIDDSTIVIKITEDKSQSTEPGIYTRSEMPLVGHLGRFPTGSRYNYLFDSPRFHSDYYWHTPQTYSPRYYHDASDVSYSPLVPSLDLAATRSLVSRPESSYFTVDKTRHNQLVRSTLPNLYHWHGTRSHSVLPHWKPTVISGQSFTPRYHYAASRDLTTPIHYTSELSGLSEEERLKLEKYEIQSLYPPISPRRPREHHYHHLDTEPLHINLLDDNILPHRYNELNVENFNTPRISRNFRHVITGAPATTRRHFRTRSLPPSYNWRPYYFRGTPSFAVHPSTSFETKSLVPSRNVETVDKIMSEFGDSNDVQNHRFHGQNYNSTVSRTGQTSHLRPPSSYQFYRQVFKKHMSAAPYEAYNADYLSDNPSISVYRAKNDYRPASNTIYQDGQFFEHQIDMSGKILTPPTRVTKPEDYIQRSASGEYARVISKQDFEPRYSFQRFSVV